MPAKRYFSEDDPEIGVAKAQLRRFGRARQLQYMEAWFRQNFEDPAQSMPYNGAEGGYQYIYGGPFEPRDELYTEFGSFISEDRINELASDLERELTEWAPSRSHPERAASEDEAFDDIPDALDIALSPFTFRRPKFGSSEEGLQRDRLALALENLEEKISQMNPVHGGIGHNNPPVEDDLAREEALEASQGLRLELAKGEPDIGFVGQCARKLQNFAGRLASWMLAKGDKLIDSFVDSLGKKLATAVVISPAAIVLGPDLVSASQAALEAIIQWLHLLK